MTTIRISYDNPSAGLFDDNCEIHGILTDSHPGHPGVVAVFGDRVYLPGELPHRLTPVLEQTPVYSAWDLEDVARADSGEERPEFQGEKYTTVSRDLLMVARRAGFDFGSYNPEEEVARG